MTSVDDYINSFPKDVMDRLNELRKMIHEIAPESIEQISYGMPAYKTFGKPLVYFAGFKHHIGLYATPSGHSEFAEELSSYKQGKGSVQFPLIEPLPLELISRIIRFRADENKAMAK